MKRRPHLVLTYPFDRSVLKSTIGDRARVILADTKAKQKRAFPEADALITLLNMKIDASLLDRTPRLKVVGNYAVGVDNEQADIHTAEQSDEHEYGQMIIGCYQQGGVPIVFVSRIVQAWADGVHSPE